jgi:pyroglutamyl-peptidase
MTKRVLVTGFEPFGGEAVNASWEAVRLLDGRSVLGYRIAARRLSCVFGGCADELIEAIESIDPAAVIATGVNLDGTSMQIERVAINLDDARIADNAQVRPVDRPIVDGAPAAYFSGLPVKAIARDLDAARIPVSVSNSAGTYVCNHLYFALMHYVATRRPDMPAGFLHVPPALEPDLVAEAVYLAAERAVSGERAE